MKIMLTWTIEPGCYDAVVKYFLDGKEKIPKGMKLAGRWHAASHGWALAETDDLLAVYRFTRQWQGMIRFVVTPVMDDAETAAVLK
jgi:hypothetical protein